METSCRVLLLHLAPEAGRLSAGRCFPSAFLGELLLMHHFLICFPTSLYYARLISFPKTEIHGFLDR